MSGGRTCAPLLSSSTGQYSDPHRLIPSMSLSYTGHPMRGVSKCTCHAVASACSKQHVQSGLQATCRGNHGFDPRMVPGVEPHIGEHELEESDGDVGEEAEED